MILSPVQLTCIDLNNVNFVIIMQFCATAHLSQHFAQSEKYILMLA